MVYCVIVTIVSERVNKSQQNFLHFLCHLINFPQFCTGPQILCMQNPDIPRYNVFVSRMNFIPESAVHVSCCCLSDGVLYCD